MVIALAILALSARFVIALVTTGHRPSMIARSRRPPAGSLRSEGVVAWRSFPTQAMTRHKQDWMDSSVSPSRCFSAESAASVFIAEGVSVETFLAHGSRDAWMQLVGKRGARHG